MWKYMTILMSGLTVAACSMTSASLVPSDGSVQAANVLGEARTFSRFAGGRDLATQIHGNPFRMDNAEFAGRVTDILNARNAKAPTHFTTRPGPSAEPAYRTVLVFNRAAPINGHALCAATGPVPSTAPRPGRIPIDLAFCEGSVQLHGVSGTLPAVTDPSDRRFADALAIALYLAQPQDVGVSDTGVN